MFMPLLARILISVVFAVFPIFVVAPDHPKYIAPLLVLDDSSVILCATPAPTEPPNSKGGKLLDEIPVMDIFPPSILPEFISNP